MRYCHLSSETLLHIIGADAPTFLQGQMTCDLRDVAIDRALPGVYCSAQGRVLADFLLVQLGPEHYALRLRHSIAEVTRERLSKYAVFSKVELALDDRWSVSACWGESAATTIGANFPMLSGQRYSCTNSDGNLCVVQLDEAGEQYEIYHAGGARNPWPADAIHEVPERWCQLEQARGIARIEQPIVEQFVPQALSYDLAGFISFKKGCYTGQEVVARLHYKGTSKRRLYLARVVTDEHPRPGDKLFSASGERAIGDVINATLDTGHQWHLLVSLTTAATNTGSLHMAAKNGPELSLYPPPFGLGA